MAASGRIILSAIWSLTISKDIINVLDKIKECSPLSSFFKRNVLFSFFLISEGILTIYLVDFYHKLIRVVYRSLIVYTILHNLLWYNQQIFDGFRL